MATKSVGSEEKEQEGQLENILFLKVKPLIFLDLFPMFDWITSLQLLNKQFHALIDQKCKETIKLDLSQLWSTIGDEFIPKIITLIKRFPIAVDVSLAYCNMVTDDSLKTILTELPTNPENIQQLNLFYNNRLSDSSIQWICERFPNLRNLNVGRCMHLTDKSIDRISNLLHLQKLSLLSTEFGTEAMMLLEENGCLKRLKELDVRGCKKLTDEKLAISVNGGKDLKVFSGKLGGKIW